ncbi:hypothetical protein GSF22_04160 [Micromonospora echinofusca]|uniref:Mycothiol-dependent maleylpyruvate isomerase metal-binding domain-containing protein n=1 Tax=Micromonospora echinofusca TaxID=47858 RepID=A0ABS3VL61_MICEH|nr:hypothetical protein [Micromonospora echinofusca]
MFGDRVHGTRFWDVPSPVTGWTARDVVHHLTGWLPGFLASGPRVELPREPSVDSDPVAAWEAQRDGNAGRAGRSGLSASGVHHPAHRRPAAAQRSTGSTRPTFSRTPGTCQDERLGLDF